MSIVILVGLFDLWTGGNTELLCREMIYVFYFLNYCVGKWFICFVCWTVYCILYDILLCSETVGSDMRHVSVLLIPRARGMAAYVRDGYGAFFHPKFPCSCCEMLVFRVCGVKQNLYVFSLSRNPDLDDQIFYCLLASMMAAVQTEDIRPSFLFVGDLNGHHQEWLGSTTMNRQGVAAFDFATDFATDLL